MQTQCNRKWTNKINSFEKRVIEHQHSLCFMHLSFPSTHPPRRQQDNQSKCEALKLSNDSSFPFWVMHAHVANHNLSRSSSCLPSQSPSLTDSVQLSSVAQSCPTLCDPMNRGTPGLPVHHQLPESTQTHVHWVSDAIQPSHPLSSPSCPQSFPASGSFQMSQLFTSGGQSIGVSASKSVLPMNTQDWPPSEWTGWISLQSTGLSGVFSNITVQNHQFFSTQLSL